MSSPPRGTLYVDSSALVKLIVREDAAGAYDARIRRAADHYRIAILATGA